MTEQWRWVRGYEGTYEVSDQGRVRRGDRMKKPTRNQKTGHLFVGLWASNTESKVYVHRLVAEAFLGPAPRGGLEVCHNNGNPSDNHLRNLRWDTRSANVLDEVKAGRHWQTAKTHCRQGHEFTPENTKITRRGASTGRVCRTCNAIWQQRYQAKRHQQREDSK